MDQLTQAFVDSRIQTIYGGTTEVQKEIIGRSFGSERPERLGYCLLNVLITG